MDPIPLMRTRKDSGKSLPPERLVAWIDKHTIVRHQAEQLVQIAGVDGIDPGRLQLTKHSFIRVHLLQPPLRLVMHRPAVASKQACNPAPPSADCDRNPPPPHA